MFFGCALVFGILMTLPIGGADMPVVISIYNAFTGLAVGLEGFVLQKSGADDRRHGGRRRGPAADAAHGQGDEPLGRQCAVHQFRDVAKGKHGAIKGSRTADRSSDAGIKMRYASSVIIVPGYGLPPRRASRSSTSS